MVGKKGLLEELIYSLQLLIKLSFLLLQLYAKGTIYSCHFKEKLEFVKVYAKPFPSPGDLPNLGIKPRSPTLQADSLPAEPQGSPRILEGVVYPYSSGSFDPGIEAGSPALQVDSLPTELSGKL